MVEALPFRLVIILVLASILFAIGFYEISSLSYFQKKNTIVNDFENLVLTMRNLRTKDFGSSENLAINIPSDFKIVVQTNSSGNRSNYLELHEGDGVLVSKNYNFTIFQGLSIGSGRYFIEICLGREECNTSMGDSLTIVYE
jgi:hypothetical protein